MIIQIFLLASIAFVTVLLGRSTSNARHMAYRRIFLVAFVVAATAMILFPRALTDLANSIGVGRGSDLLLYLTVVTFIGSLAMGSRRASELGHKLTAVTRELALEQARNDDLTERLQRLEAEADASSR